MKDPSINDSLIKLSNGKKSTKFKSRPLADQINNPTAVQIRAAAMREKEQTRRHRVWKGAATGPASTHRDKMITNPNSYYSAMSQRRVESVPDAERS